MTSPNFIPNSFCVDSIATLVTGQVYWAKVLCRVILIIELNKEQNALTDVPETLIQLFIIHKNLSFILYIKICLSYSIGSLFKQIL